MRKARASLPDPVGQPFLAVRLPRPAKFLKGGHMLGNARLGVPLATQRLCVIFSRFILNSAGTTLVRCARRTRLVLVGTRTIQTRHRNSHQPEVHAKLRAMMNQMIHDNAAEDGYPLHGENLLTARE
jgi:hypothetical protein